ncbi:single-stranded DNA binding protein [Acinetobacter phage vB_AbaM_PhT2]|uniref:Single-stranded DNA-binding protein n=1 Tax=Acinetobacter phage vB_AbaM_PhT2 TaxID=2690230 RepID=A0A6B9SW23_9CAUD|nr:single strand DNA binding protein [Acinetobacter phage vB_AbaM_PhT2]QQO96433.1 single-stranded DNA binding protein [Acinetobacter phage Minot]QQO96682.1 single-stranded DNA binding protein [Acinetobacter phage Mokit]QQO96935.1 single-stranded DNA binding protein [Acinetobacter phage Melin]SSU39492.1 gp32 DNA binding protein like [Acinetobacter baumannii]QHJ75711.1 single-stranded DNA binding protein [Acinetobacter phage vB_AbaM_PhT2]
MFQRKDPAQLAAHLQELKGGSSFNEADGKEWKLTLDTAGNGSAVIRFLPGKTPDSMPFVKLINHGFKIGSKWYIENCTSTHGKFDECPVCKHISENDLYNTDNAMYGKLKRKSSFWANILVVKDPAHPENDGKVFKYRFGQKIMDKINSMVEVDTDIGEVPVDVTCPFDGANFIMKVKKVSGFSNYDDCKFQKQSKIPNIDDPAFQAKLIEDMFDIDSIIAKDKFNSYEKNLESFNRVMGTAALGGAAAEASKNAEAVASELEDFEKQMSQFTAEPTSVTPDPVQSAEPVKEDPELNDLLNGL